MRKNQLLTGVLFSSLFLIFLLGAASWAQADEEIRLDSDRARAEVGASFALRALSEKSFDDVWWHSTDDAIADVVVSEDGFRAVVRAWREGNAIISVNAADNGSEEVHRAECHVEVMANEDPEKVSGIRIMPEKMTIERGKSDHLTAYVVPETASNQNITWRTSDAGIATVSAHGNVTGVSAGNATIRVISEDGGFVAECAVNVVEKEVRVTGIILNHASTHVYVNGTRRLIAYVRPENATNKRVRWVSSNRYIASVSQGGVVIGNRRGRVVISAITEDGGFIAESIVSVREGWLDFLGAGCSTGVSSPVALFLLGPLLVLCFRRRK
jgi:hypothetical protein